MEITRFIQTLETLQNDVPKASFSAIEKDILLKKVATLYENLLLKTTTETVEKSAISPQKTAPQEEQKTEIELPKPELIEVISTPQVEPPVVAETKVETIDVPKVEIPQETQHSAPEKTVINAEIPTIQKPLSEEKPGHSLLDLKTERSSLNERFQQNAPSLNERLQQNDLRKMLDFNRTILFTTELFGKDSVAFGKAIDKLNASQSIQEAFAYLNNEIIHQYKWKPESESVKLFEQIVRQKFGLQ